MALPLDVRDMLKSASQLVKEREETVALHVLVDIDAPEALVEQAREALRPRTSGGLVQVDAVAEGVVPNAERDVDAVIALYGTGTSGISGVVADYQRLRVPVAVVAVRQTEDPRQTDVRHPIDDTLVGADAEHLVNVQLASWLADKLGSKRMALAHNFDFTRRAVAEEAVKSTSWQNAIIGTVTIIPGADMPLMTANQAKMLLQIAAAYGQSLGADRIKELVAIVGGGFLLRALARQALDFVPGFGWLIKGGVAYTGTMAMGKAAVEYFEQGIDLNEVAARLTSSAKKYRGKIAERMPRRSLPREDRAPIVAEQQPLPSPPATEEETATRNVE